MATLLLEAFIITITECFSDEISEPEISNHILKREGALDLSKDKDFIELYNLVSDYSKTSKNAEQINYFISKVEKDGDLNSEEMELLAQSMGHENREVAGEYLQTFTDLSVSLDNKYGLFDMEQRELEDIFITGFENLTPTSSMHCAHVFNACFNTSTGIYAGAMTGCVGLGLAVGAANFWNAGIGGYVAWALCSAAATYAWVSSIDTCAINFDICLNNE